MLKSLETLPIRAYRRPPGNSVVDRLAAFAELAIEEEGQSFEKGMAKAFTAILASPFFLYRSIDASPGSDDAEYPLIDEFSLASRLSYFFWSTMPDDTLLELAERGHFEIISMSKLSGCCRTKKPKRWLKIS